MTPAGDDDLLLLDDIARCFKLRKRLELSMLSTVDRCRMECPPMEVLLRLLVRMDREVVVVVLPLLLLSGGLIFQQCAGENVVALRVVSDNGLSS